MLSNQTLRISKALIFILCLTPLAWLIFALLTDRLGANPIEAITRQSGVWALRFLLISLTVTPLRWLTGMNQLIRFRRMLGLFTFFYASVHMSLYIALDQFFDWSEIWRDIIKRPFITVGFISFIGLLPLAITSTNKMMKRLGGKCWKRLHQLVYLIAILACLHYFMLVKADIRQPLIYFFIVAVLLGSRIFHGLTDKKLLRN